MDYIYGYWLPNSAYRRAQGHDYEYFVDVQHFQAPEMGSQYILPITDK
jgi:AraC family transcriptional regulator